MTALGVTEFPIGVDLTTKEYSNGVKVKFDSLSPTVIKKAFLIVPKTVTIVDVSYISTKEIGRPTISNEHLAKLNRSKSELPIFNIIDCFAPKDRTRPKGQLTITMINHVTKSHFDMLITVALFQSRTSDGKNTSSGSCRVTEIKCGWQLHIFNYSAVTGEAKRGTGKRLKGLSCDDSSSNNSFDSKPSKGKKRSTSSKSKKTKSCTKSKIIETSNQISVVESSTQFESETTLVSDLNLERAIEMLEDQMLKIKFNQLKNHSINQPTEETVIDSGVCDNGLLQLVNTLIPFNPIVNHQEEAKLLNVDEFLSESDISESDSISQSSDSFSQVSNNSCNHAYNYYNYEMPSNFTAEYIDNLDWCNQAYNCYEMPSNFTECIFDLDWCNQPDSDEVFFQQEIY